MFKDRPLLNGRWSDGSKPVPNNRNRWRSDEWCMWVEFARVPPVQICVNDSKSSVPLRKFQYILEIEGKKVFVLFCFLSKPNKNILFFRDNYGFVTFQSKSDAFSAIEHGNDDTSYPKVDLCFGGRRAFCKERYADLGNE